MKNVQLVSELLLAIIDKKVVGFDQDYLDEKYAEFDSLEDTEFDLDAYLQTKVRVKEFISKMEDFNESISIHAKTANNIYTLFAFIVLENIVDTPDDFARKYDEFMVLVDSIRNEEPAEEQGAPVEGQEQTAKPLNWDHAYKYYSNTLGASTEPPQRIARYDALKAALL